MTVIRPNGRVYADTATSAPAPRWAAPSFWLVATLALVAWGTISTLALLSALLWAALAGFFIGWVRQAFRRRSRFGESLISSIFGGGLTRDPFRLVCLDLFANALAGFAVAIMFAQAGVMNADASNLFLAQMTGGAGGGPDAVGLTIVGILFLLLALLVGMLVVMIVMHWTGVVFELYLFQWQSAAEISTMGAAKAMVEDAVAARRGRGTWEISLGRSAAQGAVTGLLVGLLLALAGATPWLSEMLRQ